MASEEARDWRTGLSLLERQRYMYEGKYACDVTFKVGKVNPEKIEAHRFVLVCGSPVFEAMLTEGREGDIVVEDVEPEVFNDVLKFMYCEAANLSVKNCWLISQAARRYKVSQLDAKCVQFIRNSIDENNGCQYLTNSILFDNPTMVAECMEFISHYTRQIFKSTEFTTLSTLALQRFLEADNLGDVSEMEIFTACLRWADVQCIAEGKDATDENRRKALGRCLFCIRFPTMSTKEFMEAAHLSKVLTSAERAKVSDYIAHRDHCYSYDEGILFNDKIRGTSKEKKLSRFQDLVNKTWSENASLSAIDFLCSRRVYVTGVGLYVRFCWGFAENEVTVKLMNDTGTILADTGSVKMIYDNADITVIIKLPKSVCIRANSWYRISADYHGAQYCYGSDGKKVVDNGDVTFTFRQSPGNRTSVKEGQIPEIIYII